VPLREKFLGALLGKMLGKLRRKVQSVAEQLLALWKQCLKPDKRSKKRPRRTLHSSAKGLKYPLIVVQQALPHLKVWLVRALVPLLAEANRHLRLLPYPQE
jgi:hypothetical protein